MYAKAIEILEHMTRFGDVVIQRIQSYGEADHFECQIITPQADVSAIGNTVLDAIEKAQEQLRLYVNRF
jgi:hypothetical protein